MKRGFALIYQLLVSAILLLLVGALVNVSRHQVFSATVQLHQLRAQYAAEAGLSCALAELSRDPGWTAGFRAEPVPGDPEATFTVRFPESVNELRGARHRAFVVVTGEVRGQQQTLEAEVSGGGSWSQGAALLASHPISLHEEVVIDGFESLRGSGSVPGTAHSNQPEGDRAVTWTADGDHQLRVTGTVSTVSAAPQAIVLEGPNRVGRVHPNAPHRRLPQLDVPALVARLGGTAGPALTGDPVVLGAGTHRYAEPNLVVHGDLELRDGARVVVTGNLTINGSVSGKGSLVVDGNVGLWGEAQVETGATDYVSVLSSGHVVISGFNGTAYLNSVASREPARSETPRGQEGSELWSDVQEQVRWLQDFLTAHPRPDAVHWADDQVDAHLAVLGQGSSSWGYSSHPTQVTTLPLTPRRDSTAALAAKLTRGGATEEFLRERMHNLEDLFRASNYTRSGDDGLGSREGARKYRQDMRDYLQGRGNPAARGGLLDIAQSAWTTWQRDRGGDYRDWTDADMEMLTGQLIPALVRQVNLLDYDRLGAAQFRGLVYARGGILADGEVTVLGSMVAAADPELEPATLHGVTLRPGEIHLEAGSRFTYVQDMFENGAANLVDLGALEVRSWRLR